jgi:LPS-assembly protein
MAIKVWYVFGLRLRPKRPFQLLNISLGNCHEKSSCKTCIFPVTVLAALILAAPLCAQSQTSSKQPSPAVPPQSLAAGEWQVSAITQESDGKIVRLRGKPAEVENYRMLFRADEIDWDENSGDMRATGHVYFRNFDKNEEIWCSRLEYNTEDERGKFYDVIGETHPRIVARRGVLTGNSPFHFEGKWAERVGEKYILYNGFVTNCQMPNPWWRLRGSRFDIIPEEHAIAHRSWFLVQRMPLFYTPFFYHSLQKEPRKSGFLIPTLVPHSQRGFMFGLGYYWAISRSYDVTYRFQDFVSGAYSHHLDFRAAPRAGTDFDGIIYGVQDRGLNGNSPLQRYSGASAYLVGKSELGYGWSARGYLNYITTFRFRQEWTQSFNEAIFSEIHSVGFLNKNWSSYTFDAVFARLENFQSSEIAVTNPVTNQTTFLSNAATIRKLPELEFISRDRRIWDGVPLWFSLQSAAGLLFRSEPVFQGATLLTRFQTSQFSQRVRLAPHITSALRLGAIRLVPSAGIDETFYSESQQTVQGLYHALGKDLVRSAHDFSLDVVFPTLSRVFQKKTLFGDKLKHVIEPRATYRYVNGVGADYPRFIRYDETELLANTNEVELSLTNRLYAKRRDTVQEIFTWELLQKRYFDPTFGGALISGQSNLFASTADLTAYAFLVGPRNTSPVASTLRASPVPGFGIQWQADYDPRYHAVLDSSFSLDYRWQRYFFSAGNNLVHTNPILTPTVNQYRFRIGFGDSYRRGWNAGLDAIYDSHQGIVQYYTAQVTYNTDCCGFSVQYHRYNIGTTDRSQFRIAFAVANIGSFGTLRKQDRMF